MPSNKVVIHGGFVGNNVDIVRFRSTFKSLYQVGTGYEIHYGSHSGVQEAIITSPLSSAGLVQCHSDSYDLELDEQKIPRHTSIYPEGLDGIYREEVDICLKGMAVVIPCHVLCPKRSGLLFST